LTLGGESGIIRWHLFLFSIFDNFDKRDNVRNSKAVCPHLDLEVVKFGATNASF